MKFLEELEKQFVNNPSAAEKSLKESIVHLPAGSHVLVHSPVSKKFENALKIICQNRNISIKFCGKSYHMTFTTPESREKEKQQAKEAADRRRDYYNYPG